MDTKFRDTDGTPEQASFELGAAIAEMRYWAEYVWCYERSSSARRGRVDETLQPLQAAEMRLVNWANALAWEYESAKAPLKELRAAATRFRRTFGSRWKDPRHQERLKKLRDLDNEFVMQRDRKLLREPAFLTGHGSWQEIEVAIKAVIPELADVDQKCFNAGRDFSEILFPIFSYRKRGENSKFRYLTVSVARVARTAATALGGNCSEVIDLDVQVPWSVAGARDCVSDLLRRFRAWLNDPKRPRPLTPGYCGLILDSRRKEVRRMGFGEGNSSPISNLRYWKIISKLENAAGGGITTEMLAKIADYTSGSLEQAISDINNRYLAPLGVEIRGRGTRCLQVRRDRQQQKPKPPL